MSAYVEQTGYTVSFRFEVERDANTPKPSRLKFTEPNFRGLTVSGVPKYQGPISITVEYDTMTVDQFQFFSTKFFPALNSSDGPLVYFEWPNPHEAGRFDNYTGVLMWPKFGVWEKGLLHDCVMEIRRVVLVVE